MSVLAVLGPTASGKSALAMAVARERIAAGRATEIVAVDAFTVYRGMDVGTAKPSPAERAEVPHHLVDVLDPSDELTVAAFQRLARAAIDEVRDRGATPLLVGGSGLYWRAVVDPLRFPPTDPQLRARLEATWERDPAGAHRHLADLDPAAAARIEVANVRRTIRALEVVELTGEEFSAYDDAWDDHASIYDDLQVAFLDPPSPELRQRIEERAEAMVAGGLLTEAARLRALPRGLSRTARQAIGYQEAFDALERGDGGSQRRDNRADPSAAGEVGAGMAAEARGELVQAIAARTRRYARRQRSWFRADPRCRPADPGAVLRRLAAA